MQKSNAPRLRKTSVRPNNKISLDSDMLRLYLAIDEKKPILEIFKEARLERSVFKESLIKLHKLGLIEQIKDDDDYIEDRLLNRFREVLRELTGPMGEVLLEDAADDMNLELSRIPKSQIADFVYKVGSDIPGTKQSTEFKEIMLKEIKMLNVSF